MGEHHAADHLYQLLREHGAYRRRWQVRAERLRLGGVVNQAAVCSVLSEYLWDAGEVPETDRDLPRRLRDRVSRALRGEVLTAATLRLFINAFDVKPSDADRLWTLLSGSQSLILVRQDARPSPPATAAEPVRHRTVALHEHHYVGADGLPLRHRTLQVVEALVDGFRRYPYRCDTDALAVDVLQGGWFEGAVRRLPGGFFAADIVLNDPLARGQTTTIEYVTTFHYRTPPPREFRRGAMRRVDNVDILVRFHPECLPNAVWWGEWESADGPLLRRVPVALDSSHAVHRYLGSIEGIVVGFLWEW